MPPFPTFRIAVEASAIVGRFKQKISDPTTGDIRFLLDKIPAIFLILD